MFNPEQVKALLNNKNISRCSSKSITFAPEFKLKAIRQYHDDGYSPSMIFKEAGINLDIVGKTKAKECLRSWRKIHKDKGEKGLTMENRGKSGGRHKVTQYKNDQDKIKYLEAKVAYLDAENDFLAKLRGLKRE